MLRGQPGDVDDDSADLNSHLAAHVAGVAIPVDSGHLLTPGCERQPGSPSGGPLVSAARQEYEWLFRTDAVSGAASATVTVGRHTVLGISDGYFVMPPDMIGTPDHPAAAHEAMGATRTPVRMPIGCFLLRGEQNILVDTGYGRTEFEEGRVMFGGRLLGRLAALGLRPDDIDIIALSHLHDDHSGTIGAFRNAMVHLGAADWAYFVEHRAPILPIADGIVEALRELDAQGRIELMDGDTDVAPMLRGIAAPGHTPGHFLYSVHDGTDRVLILGDAVYCPQQLTNIDWEVAFDVDPAAARRTRERLGRDLELHGGGALGCHFPELAMARMLT